LSPAPLSAEDNGMTVLELRLALGKTPVLSPVRGLVSYQPKGRYRKIGGGLYSFLI
jgi:hypothetical protein